MYVTLGQFSIIRLERDTQLLTPVYDYCVPEKECPCDGGSCQEDPCELFRKVQFPVGEFFPPNSIAPRGSSYQDIKSGGCGLLVQLNHKQKGPPRRSFLSSVFRIY